MALVRVVRLRPAVVAAARVSVAAWDPAPLHLLHTRAAPRAAPLHTRAAPLHTRATRAAAPALARAGHGGTEAATARGSLLRSWLSSSPRAEEGAVESSPDSGVAEDASVAGGSTGADGDAAAASRGGSVVEDFVKSSVKAGLDAARNSVEDGDQLLFYSNRRFYIYATVGSAIMPFTWASVMVYMNLYKPEAQHMHWGWIGSVYAVGGLCGGVAVMGASHMVNKLVVLDGGTHVEITTFNFLGGTNKPVVIPITMLALREAPTQRGQVYVTVDGSRTALSFDSGADVSNWALLTHILGGNIPPSADNPGESQAALRRKAERSYWKEATDKEGRAYFFHEVTREVRWELPSRMA